MTTPSDDRPRPPPLPPPLPALPPSPPAESPLADWLESGSGWRRQHWAAIVFFSIGPVRAMLFPLIAWILIAPTFFFIVIGPLLLISIASSAIRHWRYRYRFDEHELVVEHGWLYRQVRHISYHRIQNTNITRNPLHRLFGVSGLELESASGSEPEAVMAALSPAAIDELNACVTKAKGQRSATGETTASSNPEAVELPEPRREILRLSLGELVRHGLVSNRGMVPIAIVLGYLVQGPGSERFFSAFIIGAARYTDRVPAAVQEAMGPYSWLLIGVAAFVFALALLSFLSIAYSIVRFYGFTLTVDGESVRAEYGLLTRVTINIPKRRIQTISFRANPLHRLCGRISVKVETAGLTGGEGRPSSLRWLAPILPVREVARVLHEIQPEVNWEETDWQPLHPKTVRRMMRIRFIVLALIAAVLAYFAGRNALFLLLLLVPWSILYIRGYFRYTRWALSSAAIAFRSGWLVRQQTVVRLAKVQVVSLSRNPFDRRWGMATLQVDTAGADPTGHSVSIRFMDENDAANLREELERRIGETRFVWA